MHRPLAWLVPFLFVAPAIAAGSPPGCLSAPSQACLLGWAWQVSVIPTPSEGTTTDEDPRRLSESIMTELLALDPGPDLFNLVMALTDDRQRWYWLARIASPAVFDLPDYRQAITTALRAATEEPASTDQDFVSWSALLGVALKLDMTSEARSAFLHILARDRIYIQQSEPRARAAILSALMLQDVEAARDLVGVTIDPASLQRNANLRAWWEANHSVAGLEEYREAVRDGLAVATARLLSHQQPSSWPQFVELANDVGLAEEAVAAFRRGIAFLRSDVAIDVRLKDQRIENAVGAALTLKDYAAVGELVALMSPQPDWRDRERILRAWWESSPAIADVPQFRQAVMAGLQSTTASLSHGATWDFGTWIGLVGLGNDVGLHELAAQSVKTAVDVIRSRAAPKSEDEDARLAIVIRGAAMLGDFSTASELVDRMTGSTRMLEATAWITYAQKHPGRDPGLQDPDSSRSALDILLSRGEFAVAMEIAASPADYANIALPAAMAADTDTAATALVWFERLSAISGFNKHDGTLSCELKVGFAHLLVDDHFDAAPLVERAKAWMKAEAARLEMGGMLYWWDVLALEMVAGNGEHAVEDALSEADAASASEAGKALAIGGASAVAFGIAGHRMLPFMQRSMLLVEQVPSSFEKSSTLEMMARLLAARSTSTSCH